MKTHLLVLLLCAAAARAAEPGPANMRELAKTIGATRNRQEALRQAVGRLHLLAAETRSALSVVQGEPRGAVVKSRLRQLQSLSNEVTRLTGGPATMSAIGVETSEAALQQLLTSIQLETDSLPGSQIKNLPRMGEEIKPNRNIAMSAANKIPAADPTPADTSATRIIRITPEIKALAASLGNDPNAIFAFVRNEIEFEPYFGSWLDSQSVLWARRANAVDTSTLMVALLRASGIPARIGVRDVQIPLDTAARWLGFTNPKAVFDVMRIAFVATQNGDRYEGVHFLVEAYVGGKWTDYDPSYKLRTLRQGPLAPRLPFDRAAYFAKRTDDLPSDLHAAQVLQRLRQQDPAAQLRSYYRTLEIDRIQPGDSLPEPEYTVTAGRGSFSDAAWVALPVIATLTATVNGASRTIATVTTSLPEIGAEGIEVAYTRPFPSGGSGVPVLRSGKTILSTGNTSIAAGSAMTFLVNVFYPGVPNAIAVGTTQVAGGQLAAATLVCHQQSEAAVARKVDNAIASAAAFGADPQQATLDLIVLAGSRYSQRYTTESRKLTDLWQLRLTPNIAVDFTLANLNVQRVADKPFVMVPNRLALDAKGAPYQIRQPDEPLTTAEFQNLYLNLAGPLGSALEHLLWEELGFIRSISTVRGLQQAGETRIPVVTVNPAGLLPALDAGSYSDAMRRSIQQTLQGSAYQSIIMPTKSVVYFEWDGVPLFAENPQTGATVFYIINAGRDAILGGSTVQDPKTEVPPPATKSGPGYEGTTTCPNPVSIHNGNMFHQFVDHASSSGAGPLGLIRTYNSMVSARGSFGKGWSHNFAWSLTAPSASNSAWILTGGDGSSVEFRNQNGRLLSPGVYNLELIVTAEQRQVRAPGGFTWTFATNGRLTQATDRYGNAKQYNYDATGRLIGVSASGASLRFAYNAAGFITGVLDQSGARWGYEYEGDNLVASVDPAGGRTVYGYNPAAAGGQLTTIRDPEGRTLGYSYYPNGRVFKTVNPNGSENRYYYMPLQGQTMVVDEDGIATTYQYNGLGQTTRVIHDDGTAEEAAWDATGLLRSQRDSRGAVTTFDYDGRRNIVRITDAAGGVTAWTYHPVFDEPISMTLPLGQTYRWEYDSDGRMIKSTDPNGNVVTAAWDKQNITEVRTPFRTYSFTYNAAGNVTKFQDGTRGLEIRYDNLNRVISAADSLGNAVQQDLDVLGRATAITDSLGSRYRFQYNKSSDLTAFERPSGTRTEFEYGPGGYPSKVRAAGMSEMSFEFADPACSCSASGTVRAVTDPLGNRVTSTWDPKQRIRQSRNAAGNEVREEYDQQGNIVRYVNANGQEVLYEYDLLGRLVRRYLPEGTVESFEFDLNGRLIRAGSDVADYVFGYDDAGRVISIREAGSGSEVRYEYGPGGRLLAVTDPTGGVTRYRYDANGFIQKVQGPTGLEWEMGLGPEGRVDWVLDPDGERIDLTYDAAGRRTGEGSRTFQFDADGNIVASTDSKGQSKFEYDSLDRLISAVYADGSQQRFDYDAAGNRLPGDYDTANRLLSNGEASFVYDAEGNAVSRQDAKGETRYRYDSDNRLVGVELPSGLKYSYRYDVFGRRVEKAQEGGPATQYVYDGSSVLLEMSGGQVTARYTHGLAIDAMLAMERNGRTYLYKSNWLGSTTALVNPDGSVAESYDYDAFGQLKNRPSELNPFLYTGREYDRETGLYYYRARHYDPALGRFLQQDPLWDSTNPQSRQRYSYVYNNPLRWRDPFGEHPPRIVNQTGSGGNGFYEGKYRPPSQPPAPVPVTQVEEAVVEGVTEGTGKAVKATLAGTVEAATRMKVAGEMIVANFKDPILVVIKNPKAMATLTLMNIMASESDAATLGADLTGQGLAFISGAGLQFDAMGAKDALSSAAGLMNARKEDYLYYPWDEKHTFPEATLLRVKPQLVWDCKRQGWVSRYWRR